MASLRPAEPNKAVTVTFGSLGKLAVRSSMLILLEVDGYVALHPDEVRATRPRRHQQREGREHIGTPSRLRSPCKEVLDKEVEEVAVHFPY